MAKNKKNKKRQDNPSKKGNSNYAKKKKYLKAHGGMGLDYPNKPWK